MDEPVKQISRGSRFTHWLRRALWELATTVLPAVVIALLVNVYVAEAVTVEDGPSMQPNLYAGYRLMIEKVSYRLHAPRRGDVVVVARPKDEKNLIKRIVALPGETVEVRDGHTWINGQPIAEPWVTFFGGPDYPPARVPANTVFVLGDNRGSSRDSRAIGPVPVNSIRGCARFVYWPIDQVKLLP